MPSAGTPVARDTDARTAAAVRALARASRVLERASDELSLAQYRVLAAVASGDQRASRVAFHLALGKPTVSAAVDALCARGLLSRSGVETDQRVARLRLTAEGRRVLERAEGAMGARLQALAAHAPDPGRLLDALAEVGSAIDAFLEERRGPRS